MTQHFSNETSELTVKFNKENELLVRKLQETQKNLDEINISKEEMQENLKRAFMRGVCALNFEAMSILQEKKQGETKESPNKNSNLVAKTNGLTRKILDINDNLNGFLTNNQSDSVKEKHESEEKQANESVENSEGEENRKEEEEKNKNLTKKIVFYQAPKVIFLVFFNFYELFFIFLYFYLVFN